MFLGFPVMSIGGNPNEAPTFSFAAEAALHVYETRVMDSGLLRSGAWRHFSFSKTTFLRMAKERDWGHYPETWSEKGP